MLEAAAEQSRTTISDFMRRTALLAAETEVLNRAVVTISAENWQAFEEWGAQPGEAIPALAELGRRASISDK